MLRRTFIAVAAAAAAAPGLALAADKVYKIGVNAGPHAEIMEFVQKQAAKQGLQFKIIEFSDFVQPNQALDAGDIDMNSFQHLPYLERMVKDRGLKLCSVGETAAFPLTLYSKKHKSVADIPNGALIGIPNDPTNGGRALHVLETAGLIKVKPGLGIKATVLDIVENPKRIRIKELEAAQLALSLEDLDASLINCTYAIPAGLDARKDGLAVEGRDTSYPNILAVRIVDKDLPWIKKFVSIYQTPEVKAFITEKFKGTVTIPW